MDVLSEDIWYLILVKYLKGSDANQIRKLTKIPYPHLNRFIKYEDVRKLMKSPTKIIDKYMTNIRHTKLGNVSHFDHPHHINYDFSSFWKDGNLDNITSYSFIRDPPKCNGYWNLHVNSKGDILSCIIVEGEDITKISIKTIPDIEVYRRHFMNNRLIRVCPCNVGLICGWKTYYRHEFYMKITAKHIKNVWCKYIQINDLEHIRLLPQFTTPHIFFDKNNHRITTKMIYSHGLVSLV